jgi:primosomal protein N' (replication factor Y)
MRRRYYCRFFDAISCFLPAGKASQRGKKRLPKWDVDAAGTEIPSLTAEQETALTAISAAADEGRYAAFLVHGVTGSGKTELYMRAVATTLARGRRAVVLVPEISLTPQTIGRFIGRFGSERVAVLHSKLSSGERFDEWMRIRQGAADIVVGARSAVFAPIRDLGMLIIDEEHETSYKADQSPRYDTIEVAIRRAVRANALVLLGSATPSVVSRYRVETGLYRRLTLKKRYNEIPLPKVHVADMRQELANGNKSIFSAALYRRMEASLRRGRQIILFLNRRGYSPFISCRHCGYVLRCDACGISMTWHKQAGLAFCHYCGVARQVPEDCPACGAKPLRLFGVGTEKLEELTQAAFPEATVARLDLDTGARKGSIAKILRDFEKGKSHILIGTQMVAKGLDFANVDLVGVVAADVSLNIPDFRSAERSFQLITQVAGRSGRGTEVGDVVIQTWMPDHFAIRAAAAHDDQAFYDTEIRARRTLAYPPFSDILRVLVLSAVEEKAAGGAAEVAAALLQSLGQGERLNILGPGKAPVARIGEDYRYHLHIKVLPDRRTAYEEVLGGLKKKINSDKALGWRIIIDVNPFSMM